MQCRNPYVFVSFEDVEVSLILAFLSFRRLRSDSTLVLFPWSWIALSQHGLDLRRDCSVSSHLGVALFHSPPPCRSDPVLPAMNRAIDLGGHICFHWVWEKHVSALWHCQITEKKCLQILLTLDFQGMQEFNLVWKGLIYLLPWPQPGLPR